MRWQAVRMVTSVMCATWLVVWCRTLELASSLSCASLYGLLTQQCVLASCSSGHNRHVVIGDSCGA